MVRPRGKKKDCLNKQDEGRRKRVVTLLPWCAPIASLSDGVGDGSTGTVTRDLKKVLPPRKSSFPGRDPRTAQSDTSPFTVSSSLASSYR
jgi:hypothetical protein